MITQNANGTYSVEFQVNGKADYVTVNNQLPELQGGYTMAGQKLLFENGNGSLWAPLVEKAFVQLEEQSGAAAGGLGVHGDAYADISGGWWQGLTEVTGQSVTSYGTYSGESSTALGGLLSTIQAAFASHEDVIMATSSGTAPSGSNLVANHMFMVTGVNAAAGTVTLENPWGVSGAGTGLKMSFTDSIATLASDGVTFGMTSGKSALG